MAATRDFSINAAIAVVLSELDIISSLQEEWGTALKAVLVDGKDVFHLLTGFSKSSIYLLALLVMKKMGKFLIGSWGMWQKEQSSNHNWLFSRWTCEIYSMDMWNMLCSITHTRQLIPIDDNRLYHLEFVTIVLWLLSCPEGTFNMEWQNCTAAILTHYLWKWNDGDEATFDYYRAVLFWN